MHYSSITIIYNPNSTGNGKKLAEVLRANITESGLGISVTLKPTKYAGHAELLAYKAAMASAHPVIISSSGDGGYHEVVNGLMKAQKAGAAPVAGLLPAGNANDHYNSTHKTDIIESIKRRNDQRIDLLRATLTSERKPLERYAHSYIGIGLTPKVAKELNKINLNRFNEALIVCKTLFSLRPSRILVKGKIRSYDSVVFSNVRRMAKILTLSKDADPQDGIFEMTSIPRRSRSFLINHLIRSSTVGLRSNHKLTEYVFETVRRTSMQLDGETLSVDAHSEVKIAIEPATLRCLL